MAKAITKQAETPQVPTVINVAAPIVHNHMPPKTNDTVERDKNGRIAGVKRVPISEGKNGK